MEWDNSASVTPLGQMPFFIEFVKQGELFDGLVADCPLHYTSPNAPRKRDVLGTTDGHELRQQQQAAPDLTGLGLSYVAAIMPTTKVPPVWEDDPKPPRVSVNELALSLPKRAWRTVAWREATNAKLRSRFARVRVRAAPIRGEARFVEETLLIEWPKGEAAPTKYWLTTVDPDNLPPPPA